METQRVLRPNLSQQVEEFNAKYPVGTPVKYWPGSRKGLAKVSATRTAAEILSGHTPVVWVEDSPACIALSHVEPM